MPHILAPKASSGADARGPGALTPSTTHGGHPGSRAAPVATTMALSVCRSRSTPRHALLLTALQMGYLTGRREVAYANTEACIAFTRSRGVVLPYDAPRYYPPPGYYGESR